MLRPVPEVSIIVPTINESENLPALLEQIAAALPGVDFEAIIVDDDSTDNTPAVCAELGKKYPLTLLTRRNPVDGLSGAVLHGMAQAKGEYLVVMDADLQHPPTRLPALLEPLRNSQADFVLGSRYVEGGGTADGWTLFRRANSFVATLLARPFAGKITDPMSGFFALRRTTFTQGKRLAPLGYKVALELMCKCPIQNVKEIPIHFGLRTRGQSKLSLKQQFRYLEHLSRLYDFEFPRASPAVKFLIATVAGWFAGAAAYLALRQSDCPPVFSATAAYAPVILVTALFHLRYVRTQRPFIIRPRPWVDFAIISFCEWLSCWLCAAWIQWRFRLVDWTEGLVYPFAVATVVRYILRKEFLQDIRGLRRETRVEELS